MVATMGKKIHSMSLDYDCVVSLMTELRKIEFKGTSYFKVRLAERGLSVTDIRNALTHGKLVEYHTLKGTRRLLIRDATGTCVVLDLDTKNVITTYFNRSNDNHSTLKTEEYVGGGKKGLNLKCNGCSKCNS